MVRNWRTGWATRRFRMFDVKVSILYKFRFYSQWDLASRYTVMYYCIVPLYFFTACRSSSRDDSTRSDRGDSTHSGVHVETRRELLSLLVQERL